MPDPRVIVALDYDDAQQAVAFCQSVSPQDCRIKIGLELYLAAGRTIVEQIQTLGFDIFLDLKFHDIPNTINRACRQAAAMGVWMVNVHTLGGRSMLLAAREAIDQSDHRPLLLGVTVLTSHDQQTLSEIGIGGTAAASVENLAVLAADSGLDGVVCSPQEASSLRQLHGQEFILVTPGIRPVASASNDQQRVQTPIQAMQNGASYLVIGRPITADNNPPKALDAIKQQLASLVSD